MKSGKPKKRRHKSEHTCGGKRRFRDQREAINALHRIRNRSTRSNVAVRVYFCPLCKGWHHTSKEK